MYRLTGRARPVIKPPDHRAHGLLHDKDAATGSRAGDSMVKKTLSPSRMKKRKTQGNQFLLQPMNTDEFSKSEGPCAVEIPNRL